MERAQFYNLISNPNLLNNDTLSELEELTKRYPHFQMGWILYLKNLKVLADENFDKILNNVAIRIQDRKQLFLYLNNMEQIKPLSKTEQTVSSIYQLEGEADDAPKNPLIDRFLSVNINPINLPADDDNVEMDDNYDREEGEEESIDNNSSEDFVTETLAMLYYKQKKYDQAIEAFKKLSLKYPEKNVYFATRIEEIEKLKNL